MTKYLFIMFLSIGVIFLLVAGIIAYFRFGFLKHAVKTEGVMTDFRLSTGRYKSYMPVIEFTTQNGKKQTFINRVGSRPNPHKVGDRVTVFYDPSNPANATMDGFFALWLLPFIFGLIGSIFAIVGVVLKISI